jgi:hypothetical protein
MGLFRRKAHLLPLDGTGRPRAPMARRPGGRFGFWGPFPYYSRRSRGGAEVSVSGCGCCLPIPLLVVSGAVGAAWALWRKCSA